MRTLLAICIFLGSNAANAEDAKWPTAIVYYSGGIINSQKQISVDLATGTLSQVGYTAEGLGSETKFTPGPPTVRNLSANQLTVLRALADSIWNNGIDENGVAPPPCKNCLPDNPNLPLVEVTATAIQPECSIDSTGRFEITEAGVKKTYDFLGSCYSPDAGKLALALLCDAHPDQQDCETLQPAARN